MFFSNHQPISVADLGRSVNNLKPFISLCLQNMRFLNFALGGGGGLRRRAFPPPSLGATIFVALWKRFSYCFSGIQWPFWSNNTKVSRRLVGIFSLWWTSKIITLSPLSPLAGCWQMKQDNFRKSVQKFFGWRCFDMAKQVSHMNEVNSMGYQMMYWHDRTKCLLIS